MSMDLERVWEVGPLLYQDSFESRRRRFLEELRQKGATPEDISLACHYFLANYNGVPAPKPLEEIELLLAGGVPKHAPLPSLSEEEMGIALFLKAITAFRDIRKDLVSKALIVQYRVLQELCHRYGIDFSLRNFMCYEEIVEGGVALKSKEASIASRAQGCVYLAGEKPRIVTGSTAHLKQLVTRRIFGEQILPTRTLQGNTGSKGQYVGKVRIVIDPDNTEFEQGDILVTGMTRPEYVPLMSKAGAVVTDEGGVTCHAAIISRELNVPCIVGTRRATHVLRDHMLVEVNADEGMVYILEEEITPASPT